MRKIFNKENGITLIALIITIIIMLILASVTISLNMNEGILTKAGETSNKYKTAVEEEQIQLAIYEYYIEKEENNLITLKDIIGSQEWCLQAIQNDISKFTKITMRNNNKYTITSDGRIFNDHFDFIANTSEELIKYINIAEDGNIIGINGKLLMSGSFGDNSGKTVILSGIDEKSSLFTEGSSIAGITVHYKDLIMEGSGGNYQGIYTNGNFVKFSNCIFENTCFLIQYSEYEFENCTFNQYSKDNYNIWTYSAKTVTFTNCTFNSVGKSVLVYSDGGDSAEVNFNNCKFYASAPASGKAAIEVDSSYKDYIVNINNCTSTGFDKGSKSGDTLWNNKNGTRSTIYVNGELMSLN